ncbi:hypothetical protein WISP_62206 [Willisornis vidua]|uniref:Single-stranded DNA-binding protein n=1 Tax=Willisornis vidua TaxID=1566151 RepID=A0ABQ9DBJ5_9PASS|nr:hypothetical protein WISP_62206 [Willisornis vidua]
MEDHRLLKIVLYGELATGCGKRGAPKKRDGNTVCHGLIHTAWEKDEAPEDFQYTDGIIVWHKTAQEVFEKGEKIIQILLKAGFAIKQRFINMSAGKGDFNNQKRLKCTAYGKPHL